MPRKTKKTVRKGRQRGGFYEFKGAVAPGAPNWGRGSEMGGFTVDKINAGAQYGRGRRRSRSHKRGRKGRRTMRGGGKYGAVSASFVGTGSRGIADHVGSGTKFPPFGGAAHGAFNNAGAGPGNFKSFGGLFPPK